MGRRFNWIVIFLPLLLGMTSGSTVLQKRALIVERGRSTFLHPNDLNFDLEDGSLCQVQVVDNEPMMQRVGELHPKVGLSTCAVFTDIFSLNLLSQSRFLLIQTINLL